MKMKKGNLLYVNLQLFAQSDKTEKATPKRKEDARKKGQVLQSKELSTALVLLAVFFILRLLGPFIYGEISNFLERLFEEYFKMSDLFTPNVLSRLFYECITLLGKILLPILFTAMIVGIIMSYTQVGFLLTTETLKMKFERINPLSGIKRMFSARAIVELVKSILKICLIGYVAIKYIISEEDNMLNLMAMEPIESAVYICSTMVNVAIRICFVLLFLGGLDYVYQWWEYNKSLRMTKQEIKEEYKQTEGNPEIKGKIKQRQRQLSMKRMIQEIPKADVVITNPTHFAVAIKYDAKVSDVPLVLAKGQDFIAQRIKEIAKEHKIEIVENKALARALYASVEIGEGIPQDLYQAVAEVLAFVYSLKRN